jgi:hypothetical protein
VSWLHSKHATAGGRYNPGRPKLLWLWFSLAAVAGLAFGLIGDRRPFGDGLLFSPPVLLIAVLGAALLVLRVTLARPVPDVIPNRPLGLGVALAYALFLIGNFIAAHIVAR